MLFASPNVSVVEFGLKPHCNRCFGYMSMALGLDYWLVPQLTTHFFGNYEMNEENTSAVLRLLEHLLKEKGLHDIWQLRRSDEL